MDKPKRPPNAKTLNQSVAAIAQIGQIINWVDSTLNYSELCHNWDNSMIRRVPAKKGKGTHADMKPCL